MEMKHEAEKPNPSLKAFTPFIGAWETQGTHPLVPSKIFHGRATFEWIQGGAFVRMRSEIDEPEIPDGIAIFGSDNATGEYFMLYFDERAISRKYNISFGDDTLTWSRTTPEFSQHMIFTISKDGKTIISKGEMKKDDGSWEPDLELTYTRM